MNFAVVEIPNNLVFGSDQDLFPLIGDEGKSDVVICFDGVISVGKDFLSKLVDFQKTLKTHKRRLVLFGLSESVRANFHERSLDRFFDIFRSLDEAVTMLLV